MSEAPASHEEHQQQGQRAAPENGEDSLFAAPARRKEPRHKGINSGLHHSFFGGRIVLGECFLPHERCKQHMACPNFLSQCLLHL